MKVYDPPSRPVSPNGSELPLISQEDLQQVPTHDIGTDKLMGQQKQHPITPPPRGGFRHSRIIISLVFILTSLYFALIPLFYLTLGIGACVLGGTTWCPPNSEVAGIVYASVVDLVGGWIVGTGIRFVLSAIWAGV